MLSYNLTLGEKSRIDGRLDDKSWKLVAHANSVNLQMRRRESKDACSQFLDSLAGSVSRGLKLLRVTGHRGTWALGNQNGFNVELSAGGLG